MKKTIANWGNYPRVEAEERSFSFLEQLTESIDKEDWICRGNGRCYGDASLAPHVVSTLKFDKVLAFNKVLGVFETQSGITLDKVLEIIVPHGWFLPVTPGTKYITIGGAVASDVHGKNHHVDGSFSNHILEMDVMLSDGKIITCSALQNSDLFWATCGGMGLTGVITRVRFSLKKIETAFIKQKQIKATNLEHVLELFEAYKAYTYSVAWIDCLKKGSGFGRSILIVGEHATLQDIEENKRDASLKQPSTRTISFPGYLPSFALNKYTVRAFNYLYYHKNLKAELNSICSYEPFFYPLDSILSWNRGYGKRGFVQYQFVLPLESKKGLEIILKRISDKGLGSFLAVLKVFGEQESLISFPTKGYTLALDFPVRNGLFEFLDELDALVLEYGGRIYLSKDARMKPDMFWRSYPNAKSFISILEKYNPGFKISSIQSKRLQLTA